MEQEPTGARRRLGAELRRLRGNAGMRLEEAASRLKCSTSKVSRLENGKGIPQARDVEVLMSLYDVRADLEIAMLRRLVQESRSAGWWESYVDGLSTERYVLDNPARYAALETDADAVTTFDVSVLHGLAQTRGYSWAILEQRLPRHQPWEIERLVEMVVHRKQALSRADPLGLVQIVDEAALRRVVGPPGVMTEQLDHLLELAGRPNVSLQVLPFEAGTFRAHDGQFAILDIPDELGSDVVFVESHTGSSYLEDPAEVAVFRGLADEVRAGALDTERSLDMLRMYRERHAGSVVPKP
ncbi:helix-turn-helix domain-containing protein [Pseudonocardia endophytica]|uniref:helix-turn-helix domain-containing protein n=1 Tax=Pseudonocardia endophytica TaxID=401976 RepID=UPI001404E520|nr:helix-turn-helix transcriptional regulator [Pseudonocardia endophytica]